VTSVPAGGQAQIYVNTQLYSFTYPNGGSEWDPAQPLLLRPGDEIDFQWNIAIGGTAPVVTAWFRFDTGIAVNASYVTRPGI
jgi:hypothetical protein